MQPIKNSPIQQITIAKNSVTKKDPPKTPLQEENPFPHLPSPLTDEGWINATKAQIPQEVKDAQGKTALFRAVEAGNYLLTKKLIQQGYDVNTRDTKGDFPLSIAVQYFNPIILELEKVNETGMQYALIRLLLQAGANPNLRDSKGRNAYQWAVRLNNISICRLLSEKGSFDLSAEDVELISVSSHKTNLDFVKNLLDLDPSIAFIRDNNFSLIHERARHKDLSFLKMVQEKAPESFKKKINEIFQGESLLGNALNTIHEPDNLELVQFLLDNGADLSSGDLPGLICEQKLEKEFEYLLNYGFNINQHYQYGRNFLHFLIALPSYQFSEKILKLCLDRGIDVFHKNAMNLSPMDMAVNNKNSQIWLIMNRSNQTNSFQKSPLAEAILEGNLEQAKSLLTKEAALQVDLVGKTPIHYAIDSKNINTLKMLLEVVDFKEIPKIGLTGLTIMCYAVEVGDVNIIGFLNQNQLKLESEHILAALKNNNKELIEWCLQTCQKSSQWRNEGILTHAHGNLDIIKRCFKGKNSYYPSEKLNMAFIDAMKGNHQEAGMFFLEKMSSFWIDRMDETSCLSLIQSENQFLLTELLKKLGKPFDLHLKTWGIEHAVAGNRIDTFRLLWPYYLEHFLNNDNNSNDELARFIKVTIESGCEDLFNQLINHNLFANVLSTKKIRVPGFGEISLLYYAIFKGTLGIVEGFLNSKIPLYDEKLDFFSRIPNDAALFFAFLSEKEPIVNFIAAELEKQRKIPDFAEISEYLMRAKVNSNSKSIIMQNLFKFVLKVYAPNLNENENRELAEIFVSIGDGDSFSILKHLSQNRMTFDVWKKQLEEVRQFIFELKMNCKVNCGKISLNGTHEWIINQLYQHIFQGMNPKLALEKEVLKNILNMIKNVKSTEDYGLLFTALQVCPSTKMAAQAFNSALLHDRNEFRLPKALLKINPASYKDLEELVLKFKTYNNLFNELKNAPVTQHLDDIAINEISRYLILTKPLNLNQHLQEWFAYQCVYRNRQGLSDCYTILKSWTKHRFLLPTVLDTLITIGTSVPNKLVKNKYNNLLKDIILKSDDQETIIKALKALCATESKKSNPDLLAFLQAQFAYAEKMHYSEYLINILEEISRFEFQSEVETIPVVEMLLSKIDQMPHDIRYQMALTLSCIPNKIGLLYALDVVKSSTWAMHDANFGLNQFHQMGNFLMFRSRPGHLHDNRSAMIERILNSLVSLEKNTPKFDQEVESLYQDFKQNPESHKNLLNIEQKIKSVDLAHARYFSVPLFYPPGTDLIRGLSARKGDASFKESIRDFLRKGAGSCELSDGDANITGGTWKKIGHIFATHQKDLFFSDNEGCTYFSAGADGVVNNSAIIIIPSEFYHLESRRGEARIEKEGSYNNVFYQGVPKDWTKALYLSEDYKADLELVYGSEPIDKIGSKLTTDLFKDCSSKELNTFRRYLHSKDVVLGKEISLFERIHFFGKNNAVDIGKQLQNDGVQFATESEMVEESLKWAIGRELIMKKYREKDPFLFLTQDELLKLDDKQFELAWPHLQRMLPHELADAQMPPPIKMDESAQENKRALERLSYIFSSLPLEETNRKEFIIKNMQGKWRFFGIDQKQAASLTL